MGTNKALLVRVPVQDIKVEDINNSITNSVQMPTNAAEFHRVVCVAGQTGNELYVPSAASVALALI